jgi:transcriptional regulator with XRE-family HTH domain
MANDNSYAQWALEPYCIGMKLRGLRSQKGLTLAKLAAETGLSTALLSKLETDRMIPTLPTLVTICRVYGVSLGYFFSDPDKHILSISRKAHLASEVRGSDAVRTVSLNSLAEQPRLAAELMEFSASGTVMSGDGRTMADGLVYVLEGKLQIESSGLKEVLEAGDCAYLESNMAIGWSASGENSCRVLAVRANTDCAAAPAF